MLGGDGMSSSAHVSGARIIPRSEKVEPKRLYVCLGCSIHTYSNNMITDAMFYKT
jgi:hypothetical protein